MRVQNRIRRPTERLFSEECRGAPISQMGDILWGVGSGIGREEAQQRCASLIAGVRCPLPDGPVSTGSREVSEDAIGVQAWDSSAPASLKACTDREPSSLFQISRRFNGDLTFEIPGPL